MGVPMSAIEGMLERSDSELTTIITDALEYARLGLRVIPLNGKNPFMERWPERATTDEVQIKRWFRSWPDKNIGIATGGGFIAVDVDPRNGGKKSFREMTRGRRLSTTAKALTGSGGYHYLFRVDPKLHIGCTKLLPGIDILGETGQIAVEPSVHPRTGREYVWLRTPRQGIAEAPGWLVEMLTGRKERQSTVPSCPKPPEATRQGDPEELLATVITRFPVDGRGQRNDVMVRAIGSLLGRGYTTDLTMAVVTDWWRHYYRQGVVGTPPTEAPRLVAAAINSMLSSPTFSMAKGTDHRAALTKIQLAESQESFIGGLVNRPRPIESPPHSNRVTHKRKLRALQHERPFVQALVIYFTYKVIVLGESLVKATNDQIRWVLEDRYGLRLTNQQFERLAARYITRPGKPATRFELAVQTVKGHQRVASEYELTGIKQLLRPDSL